MCEIMDIGDLTDDEDIVELIELIRNPRNAQIFRARPNHFLKWRNTEFRHRFRLPKQAVRIIIDEIDEEIASRTNKNHALSSADMVFITLRYLATGAIGQLIGDSNGVDKASVSRARGRAISKVITAIARRGRDIIKMPETEEEEQTVRRGFFEIGKFPRCIGALDCTHVKIQSPGGNNAELYRNRKGFFSFNVQAVCDSNLKIQDIVCRWPGSAHDSNIFKNSRLRHRFERGGFGNNLLVADAGYGIKPYLITPLTNTRNRAENLFNEAQIRTRNPIERCFGVLKRRFPVLALGVRLRIDKIERLVISAAVLHNIACILNDHEPFDTDEEIEAAIRLTENVNDETVHENGINNNGIVRNHLIHYFENMLN